jgi:aspartyl-tRNA(Asn)/glutamyl-tRNA(Gln) amidotransferase subunit C
MEKKTSTKEYYRAIGRRKTATAVVKLMKAAKTSYDINGKASTFAQVKNVTGSAESVETWLLGSIVATAPWEKELTETLDYIATLNSIDTKNVEPTSQVTGLTNVLREDEAHPSLSQEEALQNAQTYNGFFKVPAILDHE